MSRPPETAADPSSFLIYPDGWTGPDGALEKLIGEGKLPPTILFKLASFGCTESDPVTGKRLVHVTIKDLVTNAESPELMTAKTRELLFGPMPDAIIDWEMGSNIDVYRSFDDMYYRVYDLQTVIVEQATAAGNTSEGLRERSRAAAKGIWRAIVTRHHPEWLKDPGPYYVPTVFHLNVYEAKPPTMRRRIIGQAVLSDPLVYATYVEATKVGVKGIGTKGKASLRALLSEEHPELM